MEEDDHDARIDKTPPTRFLTFHPLIFAGFDRVRKSGLKLPSRALHWTDSLMRSVLKYADPVHTACEACATFVNEDTPQLLQLGR